MKLISLLLVFGLSFSAYSQDKTISVQGKGVVSAVPDGFTLTIKIEERGESVSKLNQSVTQSTQQIIRYLRNQGIEDNNIQTMHINLTPWYENYQRERKQSGFMLSRTIRLSHATLTDYDKIIDGVLKNGANRIESFEFIVMDEESLYFDALEKAVTHATQKAQKLLKPTKQKLGSIQTITEQQSAYQPVARMRMAADSEINTALPGMQNITALVSVVFFIE